MSLSGPGWSFLKLLSDRRSPTASVVGRSHRSEGGDLVVLVGGQRDLVRRWLFGEAGEPGGAERSDDVPGFHVLRAVDGDGERVREVVEFVEVVGDRLAVVETHIQAAL